MLDNFNISWWGDTIFLSFLPTITSIHKNQTLSGPLDGWMDGSSNQKVECASRSIQNNEQTCSIKMIKYSIGYKADRALYTQVLRVM